MWRHPIMLQDKKRNISMYQYSIYVLFVQCILYNHPSAAAEKCVLNGYDLKDIEKFSPWKTTHDTSNATITISLCSKLSSADNNGCPDGTSICAKYPNGTAISYGTYQSEAITSSTGNTNGELMLAFKGQSCPDFEGEQYASIFYFKCGKTLGHPYHLGDLGCSIHFEWESYLFCKDFHTPEKEVPCTVMKDGHLIDLSPLTKLTGAYLVDEVHNRKIYINVCRDIKSVSTATDDGTSHCPSGAAICRVVGDKGVNFGEPTQRLHASGSGVQLVYESSVDLPGCSGKPKTTINFECPHRGGSQEPVLISDFLCQYEIRWVTDYACPVEHITSKSCQLTSDQHDVDIDLSPLRKIALKEHPYLVNASVKTSDNKNNFYRYYINMCGGLGFECGHAKAGQASVCQKKDGADDFSEDLGQMGHGRLTYAGGELIMHYRNGDSCHTNLRRSTFINFHCNKSAVNDGAGYPVFDGESEDCTYEFSWDTKYACIDHPVDDSCRVEANGKRFDLSTLVKERGKNWEVLVSENHEDESFYVNVCHDVLRKNETSKCPPGSAMCAIGKDGAGHSLGKYSQGLQYDETSDSLKLVYTDGDKTDGGCVRTTSINFFCLPGVLDSAPKLVHESQDKCYHELEWHTAAACILSHKTGSDCKVYDDDAGYHFDLSPLTKLDGFYKANDKEHGYTYYINVCDTIKGSTPCDADPHKNASVCQVKTSDQSQAKKTGEPGALVEYYDGVLNLTYTHGEAYNNAAHNPRITEIAFLCDVNAGPGNPEFLVEKDYTYAFEWRTSYACPITPVECLVTDPASNKQYDLSSLSNEQNWELVDSSDPANKKKFYINVCQPLSKVKGDHCSSFAAACVTKIDSEGKESLFHGNLGRAESSPTVETSTNGVKLLYTRGNECEDNGVKKKYTTSIHFVCVKGKVTGGPLTPKLIKPCEYSLIWETSAACPVDHITPGSGDDDKGTSTEEEASCSIKDPNSDFTFNLMPLKKRGDEFYEVKSTDGKKTYKLNICDALADSVCGKFDGSKPTSVCEDSTSAAVLSKAMTFSSAGKMTLAYKGKTDMGSGQEKHYTLNFYCKQTAQQPEISMEGEEAYNINFRVYTALACLPRPVDCKVVDDKGREYDLSPLARKNHNWEVIDTRPDHSNLLYYINVCRPVVPSSTKPCPGGAVGGCQTGDKSYNLGYVQSKPVAASDGSALTIVYQGGDKCHVGKDVEAFRSTRITFLCDGVEHSPEFESESETCEYRFIWRTPSACPQHRVIGSGCKVKDPLYNYEFDLSALRKSDNDYKVPGDGYDFYLNACGPLVHGSVICNDKDIGACQTGTTLHGPVEAGLGNDKLIYNSGQLSLEYSDGRANCHGKYNRTTIIHFVCGQSTTGTNGPRYILEKSDCTYIFDWETSYACPPNEVLDCSFTHGHDVFDLSRLSLEDDNYMMHYNASNKMYILNVCRSLVYKKGQTCPFEAAACEIDLTETDEKKKYHNMGKASTMSLSFENEIVKVTYSSGEMCSDGKTHRSTEILLDCDKTSDALGTPRSHFQSDGCKDSFFWTSGAACPLVTQGTIEQPGHCKVKNPETGYEFDLSSLKEARGYKTYDREGHMFELNVCESLGNKKDCSDGTGSCRTDIIDSKKGTNAGKFNDNLKFRDGVLVLEYTGGDTCNSGSSQHSTFINFVCSPGSGRGVPVYVDKSGDCEYYFDWHTDLACEKQIECSVKTDKGAVLDFSPLVRQSGKYNVLSNVAEDSRIQGMVYLNLCRPLNPVFGTLCPPGSGTCLVRSGTDNKPLSLGRVHNGMTYDKDTKEVRLTYDHGDPCPSKPEVNMSSVVILKCHRGEGLEPELDLVTSDCQYMFTWFTPLACVDTGVTEFSKTCKYYDKNTATTFDLSQLNNNVTVKTADQSRKFLLKPCGHLEDKGEKGEATCTDASVCVEGVGDKSGSLGRFDKATVSKNYYTLDLKYTEGRACKEAGTSTTASSTIMFKCDRTAGLGQPTLLEAGECHASFIWETSLVCIQERKECTIGLGGAMFDFNFLSQDAGSWNYTDSNKNIYWLNLCQQVQGPNAPPICAKHNAAVCMKAKDGTVSKLGDLDTQVIKVEDSSKDHSSVLIQYSQGYTSVCSKGRRRRRDLSPTVSIHLKCADTLGAPVLKKDKFDSEKCVFEFEWSTRIACQIGKNPKEVPLKDGKILDARSGRTVDLSPLLQRNVHPSFVIGGKQYAINLLGEHPSYADTMGTMCKGAAVCQKAETTRKYRNLGSSSRSAYYVKDEKIEVVFTSPEKCTGKNQKSNVTSTVVFNCNKDSDKNDVELLYQTSDCAYIFAWETKEVCFQAKPSSSSGAKSTDKEDATVHKAGSGGSGSSKIGIGVSIVVGIVVICILILVLHRPERRAALKIKVKSCILCRKSTEAISYSKLSASADDADLTLDDDPFNPFNEPDEEAEINNGQLPVQVHSFHDDSDEDLLL